MSITAGSLNEELRDKALELGATYFGVADLIPVRQFITTQGGDFLAEYPVGVSAGVVLADGIVDQLHNHLNGHMVRTYHHHIYSFVAGQLDRIAGAVAAEIEGSGYRALPIPHSGSYDRARLQAIISHKLVAHMAGLGRIGKNSLLITKKHGPRVRWVTVLTDAPLAATGGATDEKDPCKSCSLCVDLCPVHAFAGIPFDPNEAVEVRFNTKKCRQYLSQREETYDAAACGLCVYVCPRGWSMKRKKGSRRTTPALLRQQLAEIVSTVSGNTQARPVGVGDSPGRKTV